MSTVTYTLAGPESTRLSIKDRGVFFLMRRLLSSGIFSEEEIKELDSLIQTIDQLTDSEDIITAYCFILFNFIYPKIKSNPTSADFWLDIEKDIKIILGRYIPSTKDVDQLIEEKNEEMSFINHLASLEEDLYVIVRRTQESAQAIDVQLQQEFDGLKERLLEVYTAGDKKSESCKDKINVLMQRVKSLIQQVQRTIKKGEETGAAFEQEQIGLKNILERKG